MLMRFTCDLNKTVSYVIKNILGFLVPSGLTFGDFLVANFLHLVEKMSDPLLFTGEYPELGRYVARIHGLDKLANYIATRKAE